MLSKSTFCVGNVLLMLFSITATGHVGFKHLICDWGYHLSIIWAQQKAIHLELSSRHGSRFPVIHSQCATSAQWEIYETIRNLIGLWVHRLPLWCSCPSWFRVPGKGKGHWAEVPMTSEGWPRVFSRVLNSACVERLQTLRRSQPKRQAGRSSVLPKELKSLHSHHPQETSNTQDPGQCVWSESASEEAHSAALGPSKRI